MKSPRTLLAIFLASSLIAAPIQAATPTWEYTVVNAKLKNRDLANLLNSHGNEGWELVQINHQGVAIFKRPKR